MALAEVDRYEAARRVDALATGWLAETARWPERPGGDFAGPWRTTTMGGPSPWRTNDDRWPMAGYAVAHLDEIEEFSDAGCHYRPIRHQLGITAFGATAWT